MGSSEHLGAAKAYRILFLVTRADSFGGSSVHVRDMAVRLRREGHEVLVGVGGEGPVTEALTKVGVPYRTLRHLIRQVDQWRDWKGVWEVRRLIREFRPDLVSTHTAKAGALGRVAAWSCGVPAIYTPHCWSFGKVASGGGFFLWIERIVRPFGRRVICVSEDERQQGIARRVGPPDHFTTVHNGMPDIAPELLAKPAAHPPTVVMVGRFEAQKDQRELIEVLARRQDLAWKLRFVGDGPLESLAKDAAREFGVADRVEFLGFRTDVAQILAGAQIYALVSHWEGFARSIVEAMRAGLPVVACDVGGNREAVIDGVNGYLVPHEDAAALSERMTRLLSDPALRAQMGQASRRRYEAEFTFEAMFRKTTAVYASVLA